MLALSALFLLSFNLLRFEQIIGKTHATNHGSKITYHQLCCLNISRLMLNDKSIECPWWWNSTAYCNLHFFPQRPSISARCPLDLPCIPTQPIGCMRTHYRISFPLQWAIGSMSGCGFCQSRRDLFRASMDNSALHDTRPIPGVQHQSRRQHGQWGSLDFRVVHGLEQ